MAGLLDQFGEFLNTPGGMGLLSAVAAGLAGARRGQPLNSLGAGLLGGVHGYNQAQEQQMQQKFSEQRGKLFDAQMQDYQAQADLRKADALKRQNQMAYMSQFQGDSPGPAPVQLGSSTAFGAPVSSQFGMVDTPNVTQSASAQRPPASNGKADPRRMLELGFDPKFVEAYMGSDTLGMPEVARTLESQDAQGNKITLQFDKFGRPVGDGVQGYTAPVQVDLGGRVQFVKPQAGVGFAKSMTPGEVAADRRAGERLRFDKEQSAQNVTYQQDANGNFVALPTKSAPGAVVRGAPVVSGPGMTPLQGKGGGMTEDQAKATGWLSQAENAWRNMQSVMYQRDEKGQIKSGQNGPVLNKDVISPGFFEANTPGEAGNRLRSPQRQQFVQASESIGEALLRAATGAGVNKDEAAQKARELTPQRGDSEQVIQQKMASIPVYLESLRVRAGPGAKKVPSAGPVTGQFLGFE